MRILIADDDIITRKLLDRLLSSWNYQVVCCEDGQTAWNHISSEDPPDIAILDWHMPGLTGLEVSQKALDLENHEGIYMQRIILSATVEKEQIVQALHSGAHDFMLKPVDTQVLRMRMSVAERTVKEKRASFEMEKILQAYSSRMENLAQERAKQLIHAERMSSLGTMCAGVAHEINNPLSFISGNAQGIENFWNDIAPILRKHLSEVEPHSQKIQFILEEFPKSVSSMKMGVTRISKIVKSLKRFAVKETNNREQFDVNDCVSQAIDLSRATIGKSTSIQIALSAIPLIVSGNQLELEQVLINLIVNAGQAMGDKNGACISVSSARKGETVIITIEDCGPGIPDELLAKIWDPFFTTKPIGQGTGLGLSISMGIVRDHLGELKVANRLEGGARFTLALPTFKDSKEVQT